MSFIGLLNTTCSSVRPAASGQSASGRQRATNSAVLTSEPCRLQSRGGKELIGDRETAIEDLVLFVRASADILEDDIVTVNAKNYEVKLVQDGGGAGHHWECVVKLVKA